jgi:tripartite-type tricarboxylate transporter receptor subunit TctC
MLQVRASFYNRGMVNATDMQRREVVFGLAAALSLSACSDTSAPEDFYRGETIQVYIGLSPGGAYDVYARMLARHMGKHIPGNPRLVPSNMEGAGSLTLTNYLYNVAPKDGTVIGTINRGAPFEPLIGEANLARFDPAQFTWIGSVANEVSICAAWERAGIDTFDQLLTRELTVGGTGSGADTNQFPKIMNGVLGTKLKVVSGYPGGNNIDLAMERGEVDGRCGWSWSSIVSTRKAWLDSGSIKVLVQLALEKHPDLPDVPLIMDYAKTDEERAMLRLIFSRSALGCPFLAPPGIPAERAAILRKAFDDTMKDPEFLAEAAQALLEVAPVRGEELQRLIADIYQTPKDVVDKARELVMRGT